MSSIGWFGWLNKIKSVISRGLLYAFHVTLYSRMLHPRLLRDLQTSKCFGVSAPDMGAVARCDFAHKAS